MIELAVSGAEVGPSVLIPACVTILLTITGLIYKHLEDVRLQRRKDQLERVNLQLRQLYGPLYALSRAGADAWSIFRQQHRPSQDRPYFDPADPPGHPDQVAYRFWMEEVFMPINLRLEAIIVGNADLLLEQRMPPCLVLVCAHVNAYKPILRQWREGDYREHEAPIAFPEDELTAYLQQSFLQLQQRQRNLLGLLKIKGERTSPLHSLSSHAGTKA